MKKYLFIIFSTISLFFPVFAFAFTLSPSSGQTPINNVQYVGLPAGSFIRIISPSNSGSGVPVIGQLYPDYCRSINPETNSGFGSSFSSDCNWNETGTWYITRIQDGSGYVLEYVSYSTNSIVVSEPPISNNKMSMHFETFQFVSFLIFVAIMLYFLSLVLRLFRRKK